MFKRIYVPAAFMAFCLFTYSKANNKLIKYTNGELDTSEKEQITDKFIALRYGAYENIHESIITSLLWPVWTTLDFISIIAFVAQY